MLTLERIVDYCGFFSLLQQIVNRTAGPSDTQLKKDYFLAEETARRLLADFKQVEEHFKELDTQTRQTIIKSNLAKARLLGNIFQ
jgi:hypothetical protein